MRPGPALALLLLLLPELAFGFPRLKVHPPEGFAEAQPGRGAAYRALSPEGVLYRIRLFRNEPEKPLGFWGEALKNHLVQEGYRLNGEGRPFQAGETAGTAFEWVVPFGTESYLYLTAVLVNGRRIVVAEAAGPYALISRYRQGLLESLQSIRLR
jgi:hypothetical protein